jgi:3-dehydroquinate synthase
LSDFREHLGGRLTIVNLKGIAQPFDVHEIDEAVMKDVLLNRSDAPLA